MISVAIDARFVGTATGLARYRPARIQALWDLDDPEVGFAHLVRTADDLPEVPERHRVAAAALRALRVRGAGPPASNGPEMGADVPFSPRFVP